MQEAELRGSPSLAMWLVNGFQLLYVGDALWYEVRLDWTAGGKQGILRMSSGLNQCLGHVPAGVCSHHHGHNT